MSLTISPPNRSQIPKQKLVSHSELARFASLLQVHRARGGKLRVGQLFCDLYNITDSILYYMEDPDYAWIHIIGIYSKD